MCAYVGQPKNPDALRQIISTRQPLCDTALHLVSLLTLLAFLTSACAEDSLTGVVEVCQLDLDCDDSDPCTVDLCDGGLACLNLAAADGDACIGGEPDSICVEGDCIPSECGDGYLDDRPWIGEVCDDGNTIDGDGCAADCTQTHRSLYRLPDPWRAVGWESNVTVLGRVVDYGVGFESVTVNGVSVELDEDGDFEFPLAATHGLNTLSLSRVPWQGMRLPGPRLLPFVGLRRASGKRNRTRGRHA